MQYTKNIFVADLPHLDLLSRTDISPIFIMGDHRSGTTLLYKTLVATGCFNFLKAYHVIKYNEILANHINDTEGRAVRELEKLFESLGIRNRTIDKVMVTTDLPEEYGFILNSVVGNSSCITPDNLSVFQQLCRKIQFLSALDKPLLLKNPWDYSQFICVKEMIPSAKFIFIHRHPLDVINSKFKSCSYNLFYQESLSCFDC